jgi:hypothetical protein
MSLEPYDYSKVQVGDVWYRYKVIQYAAPLDEYDEPIAGGGRTELLLETLYVTKLTKTGVKLGWYKTYSSLDIFQSFKWTKQFACPTKALALASFRAKTNRYVSIMEARIVHAKYTLKLADREEKSWSRTKNHNFPLDSPL